MTSRMMTPAGFQDRLLSHQGAAFGMEPRLTQSAWFRPHNVSEDVSGLYLVGAGTHPGAGLPGVLCSAKVLDRVIPAVPCMADADLAACRDTLRGGSRSFFAAALLLPRRVHRPATALYAFCRIADDLIDEGGGPVALAALRRRLDAIYAGRPIDVPADRALAAVLRRHLIPRLLLDELLEGFAWDAEGRRYEDLSALYDYAAKVAGTVGVMMAVIMGVRDRAALARAADLGVAMQLTNIARDVGEDARAGRLYLPLQWLRQEGVDPEAFLARPAPCPRLAGVVARLIGKAELLYVRADAGIAALPLDCRVGIGTARLLYAAIGQRVIRNRYDSVTARARVGAGAKLRLAARSALSAPFATSSGCNDPALAEVRHLVAAAISAPPSRRPQPAVADRVLWLATLFAELDERRNEG